MPNPLRGTRSRPWPWTPVSRARRTSNGCAPRVATGSTSTAEACRRRRRDGRTRRRRWRPGSARRRGSLRRRGARRGLRRQRGPEAQGRLHPGPAAEAIRGGPGEAARGPLDQGPHEAPRQDPGERRPPQGEAFEGGPALRGRGRRRRQGRQRRRGPAQAQPPARRGGRGERLLRPADLANRLGRRSDPAGALEIVGNRSHFPLAEIGARARAPLPPAGQADRLAPPHRGSGLPSGASGPDPPEGAGNPFGLDVDPGAHAQLGPDHDDAAPNRRSPGGEPAGFQSRRGAGADIAGRRRRAGPSPLEVRAGRLAPPPGFNGIFENEGKEWNQL